MHTPINNRETKTWMKNFHDMNQDAKSVFGDVYVYKDGIIFPDLSETGGYYGIPVRGIVDNYMDNHQQFIYGKNFYRVMKNFKKYIVGFDICHDYIKFVLDSDITPEKMVVTEKNLPVKVTNNIASSFVGSNDDYVEKCMDLVKETTSIIENNKDNMVELTEEQVHLLMANKRLIIKSNGTSVRIAKNIIPGLKKTHGVSVVFHDVNIDNLMGLIIIVERASMTTYHRYRFYVMDK